MTTIEISIQDFIATHPYLVRLLKAIQRAGPRGLSTFRLCDQVFKSHSFGLKVIEQAEMHGYIKRTKQSKPKGEKGHWLKVNTLTPKGKALLEKLF
jgi:hypothetical protein